MGKDQELLEAARTGNLQAVRTILSGKSPRASTSSGGLTGSLRSLLALKHVNVNCTDNNGETPLHLAALNGHMDVVVALLTAKASVVEVDSKGCTPLHLAAWNGHAPICELLLDSSPDKSIVNVQTTEGETPLHFAAQHGHLDVVTLLLKNKADPTYRTLSERSALDLAAQYGKTDVVRTLVTGRPELLAHSAGQPSPLHQAAFNGHVSIVRFLLDSGFPVNTRTDNGTALHEAATSCKLDVIKLLLDRGVDVWAQAKNGMTAEDILRSINSRLTKDALQIISGHVNSQRTPDSDGEKDENGIPGPGNSVQEDVTSSGTFHPVPKTRTVYPGVSPDTTHLADMLSASTHTQGEQLSPPPLPPRISLRPVDFSKRESMPLEIGSGHLIVEASARSQSRSREASPMSGNREQPKKPPRKTPSVRRTEATQNSDGASTSCAQGQSNSMEQVEETLPDPMPCVTEQTRTEYVNVEFDRTSSTFTIGMSKEDDTNTSVSVIKANCSEHESPSLNSASAEELGAEKCIERTDCHGDGIAAEEDIEGKHGKPKSLQLDGSKKRDSSGSCSAGTDNDLPDLPLSPTNYPQPPTPDCPPPSPSTAMHGIHLKINPQDKRKSKNMETITDANLLTTSSTSESGGEKIAQASQPSEPETSSKQGDSQVKADQVSSHTDCELLQESIKEDKSKGVKMEKKTQKSSEGSAEDVTLEMEVERVQMRRSMSAGNEPLDWQSNVFAGLLKGSTPGGSRKVVSQICENVVVKTVRSKRRSTPSGLVTFDPLMEKEEDKDMVDTQRIFHEIDNMAGPDVKEGSAQRETHKSEEFDDTEEWANIADIVSSFGGRISASEDIPVLDSQLDKILTERAGPHKIQSVGEWLESLGLEQYENTLVANGYDDTDFLGGTIVDDQDLASIGITNGAHRAVIVSAARRLPTVKPINQSALPVSVESWLETLRLGQYLDTFLSHKYNTMQRVVKLWELELNTVLDITSIGHRKRILASLGERAFEERDTSVSPARVRRKSSDEEEPKSPFEHIDLYRDYTGVKPRTSDEGEQKSPLQSPLMTFEKGSENGLSSPQGIRDSQIHIRPPHLMHITGSIRQWRHRPEVLIKGCCNYTAHYLGSTVIKELKGTKTTQESIAKLKQRLRRKLQKSADVIGKIPTIMLSISYKGVKFIDARSKKVICDHEIANIFCACQDGDHMNFFAYVTKDKESSKHYCHVFSVRSRELAGEIILTLGEAFEIAYQMALKERAEEDAFQFEQQLSQSDPDDSASVSSKASVNTV
ncbi:ankyrin repeat and SAM domain-containing protein 1A-like isoform X2 [Pomacea canaliculata]|uniref:ankyrin repeat and SAM domain-containing protein 1A-like isoform X2 n=1 Tax=Pomacea canaliculata TaxID=400727 RepID=UPI000D72BCC9|nr:ankyrin repeat and SAM domain-containing protein 1A-like isoform X2 [Pomacea canaliculata]